jgi:hypothetical protein
VVLTNILRVPVAGHVPDNVQRIFKMKVKNEKTITLSAKQLEMILNNMFVAEFAPSTKLQISFLLEPYGDDEDRFSRYRLDRVTVSGVEELEWNKNHEH